jgi:hypothetical protein
MAKILKPPYFETVVNAGEKRLLDFLEVNLPENYFLIPNVEIASTNPRNNRTQYWEYDLIVVAPHAVFNIENKDWKGRIEGDDNYWYLNDRQMANPLKTGRQKTAILASKLKEENHSWGQAWIQNLVSLSYQNSYQPIISREAQKLTFDLNIRLLDFITDPYSVGKVKDDILSITKEIKKQYRKNGQELSKTDLNNLVMSQMSNSIEDDSIEIGVVDKEKIHKYCYTQTVIKTPEGKTIIVEKDFVF